MYELPPFEDTFQPMKHNKYLMRRNDVVSRFVTRHASPRDKSQHVTCAGTAPARDITSRPPTLWPRQIRPGSWRRGWGRPSPGAGPSTRAASSVRTLRHFRHTLSEIISLLCQVFSCRLSFSLSSSPSSFTPTQSTLMREQFLLKRHRHDYICRHIENFRRRDSCCVGYHFHVMYRVPLFDRWCGLYITKQIWVLRLANKFSFSVLWKMRLEMNMVGWQLIRNHGDKTLLLFATKKRSEEQCSAALHCGKNLQVPHQDFLFLKVH